MSGPASASHPSASWEESGKCRGTTSKPHTEVFLTLFSLFRLAGFIVVLTESPCCCVFLDFVNTYTAFVERRPVWHKAAFYIV